MAIKNYGAPSSGVIQVGGSGKSPPSPAKPAQGYGSQQPAKPQSSPPVKRCGSCGKW
jgi:hypothetical protein